MRHPPVYEHALRTNNDNKKFRLCTFTMSAQLGAGIVVLKPLLFGLRPSEVMVDKVLVCVVEAKDVAALVDKVLVCVVEAKDVAALDSFVGISVIIVENIVGIALMYSAMDAARFPDCPGSIALTCISATSINECSSSARS